MSGHIWTIMVRFIIFFFLIYLGNSGGRKKGRNHCCHLLPSSLFVIVALPLVAWETFFPVFVWQSPRRYFHCSTTERSVRASRKGKKISRDEIFQTPPFSSSSCPLKIHSFPERRRRRRRRLFDSWEEEEERETSHEVGWRQQIDLFICVEGEKGEKNFVPSSPFVHAGKVKKQEGCFEKKLLVPRPSPSLCGKKNKHAPAFPKFKREKRCWFLALTLFMYSSNALRSKLLAKAPICLTRDMGFSVSQESSMLPSSPPSLKRGKNNA